MPFLIFSSNAFFSSSALERRFLNKSLPSFSVTSPFVSSSFTSSLSFSSVILRTPMPIRAAFLNMSIAVITASCFLIRLGCHCFNYFEYLFHCIFQSCRIITACLRHVYLAAAFTADYRRKFLYDVIGIKPAYEVLCYCCEHEGLSIGLASKNYNAGIHLAP